MFRNLIFDWSGTLVDDLGPVIEATNAVLGKYDIAAARPRGLPPPLPPALPGVLRRASCRTSRWRNWRPTSARPSMPRVTPVTVLPHAREKLEWCAALGIRTFVLTSMDTIAFERQMDEFGLRELFEATYSGVLDKREVIHRILETHGLDPAETAFVGDMTHDVETARHGGVSSIAVLTGYNHPEILAAVRPDLTVPDLGVLRTLLDRRRRVSRPIATVGALIHDGTGHVLMIRTHKWSDRWGIPGGKIERGESVHRRPPAARSSRKPPSTSTTSRFVLVQDCIDSPEFMRPEHFILLNYVARARTTAVTPQRRSRGIPLAPPRRRPRPRSQPADPHPADGSPRIARYAFLPILHIAMTPSRSAACASAPTSACRTRNAPTPQTLLVTVRMIPGQGFDGLADDISRTIDYHAVSLEIQALAAARPRRLIETLAVEIADQLLGNHPLASVAVTIEKHILPDTECVAVHLERSR